MGILCGDAVWGYCVGMLCGDAVWGYCIGILCGDLNIFHLVKALCPSLCKSCVYSGPLFTTGKHAEKGQSPDLSCPR